MGCASSAALPFLTNRGNQTASESPKMNGQPPYELQMVNNKLKENGIAKDVNESYVTDKMKEVVDSTAVQGVIGGVVQAKEEVINQIKGLGEAMSDKVTSVVDGVEDTIESAFGKLTGTVDSAEEKLKADMESMEKDIKSVINAEEETVSEMKAEDIDELLDSLPTEEEITEAVKGKKEEEEKGKEEGEGEGEGN